MNTDKKKYTVGYIIKRGLFLLMLGLAVGVACGIVGACFSHSVAFVTGVRQANLWIICLLPLGGVLSVLIYKLFKVTGTGTDDAVESAHTSKKVSARLTPAVFICSVITHLFGGSAGREGAALKMGGGIAALAASIFKLDERGRRTLALAGMSGVFAAVFGTPIGAAVFTLEVVRSKNIRPWAIVVSLVSSLCAYFVSLLLCVSPERYHVGALPGLGFESLGKAVLISVLGGLVSLLFCALVCLFPKAVKKLLKNDYLRIVLCSLVVVVLTVVLKTADYNGAGIHIIEGLFEGESVGFEAFLLKILFTAFTVAAGFKGGEIVPAFFVGATFGWTAATLLGFSPALGAAIGMVALFCGVTNCPIATLILSVEMFGIGGLPFYLIAVVFSFLFSGDLSLYDGKKIPFRALRNEERI